ncbi:MAG: 3D domain-containing protein [Candidatus Geothermincolia bacterium]
MGLNTPPASGGFAVIRACALLLAFFLAVSCMVGLAASRRDGTAVAQQAPAVSSDTDTMVKDVVTLDSEINSLKSRLSDLSTKSEALESRIETTGSKIEEQRTRLVAKRQALSARARSLYVNGRTSKLVMLVSSKGVTDYMNRADMLQKVAERDAQLIADTKKESDTLKAFLTRLKSDKSEIDKVSADLRARQKRLEKSRDERASVLAAAGAKSQEVVAQTSKVEARINKINPPEPVNGRPSGRVMSMVATAYCPLEPGLDESTASGMRATKGVVAVDPRVIPLGTRLNVEGYGNCIAGDTGSAIKGNRIDLCYDTLEEMDAFGGYRTVRVEILD